MKNSMQHWNGKQVVVIDTETNGLKAGYHEILQIAMLPLDSNFQQRQDILPLYMYIKPNHPRRTDMEALKVNKLKLAEINERGFDSEVAKDLLIEWIDKLGLPCNKYGKRCQVIPLGQNYSFDMSFIKAWLGIDLYYELFDYHYKDTMIVAGFLNDKAATHGEKVPFAKIGLKYLANLLNVEILNHHDALQDCLATAEVYRKLVNQGLLG